MITLDNNQIKLRASTDMANNSIGPLLSHYIGQTYGWGDLTPLQTGVVRLLGDVTSEYTTFSDYYTSASKCCQWQGCYQMFTYGQAAPRCAREYIHCSCIKIVGNRDAYYNVSTNPATIYQNVDHSTSIDIIDNKLCALSNNKIKILNRTELYQALLDGCMNYHLGSGNTVGLNFMTINLSSLSTSGGRVYSNIGQLSVGDANLDIYKCSNSKPTLSSEDRLYKYTGTHLSAVSDNELEALSHLLRLRMADANKGLYYVTESLPANRRSLGTEKDTKIIHSKEEKKCIPQTNPTFTCTGSYFGVNYYSCTNTSRPTRVEYSVSCYTTCYQVHHSYSTVDTGRNYILNISI